MTYATIQELLDDHLQTLTGLPPLQLENTQNIGNANEPFVRATLLPARKSQLTLGITGKDSLSGLYQVDVFVPEGTGTAAVNALVDEIVEHFPRGLMLTQDEVAVHTQTASRLAGGRIEPFYMVSVQVTWQAIV